MRRAWYWTTIVMTCLVLVLGTLAVVVRMNNGKFLSTGNVSMSPAINKGDLAIIKQTSAANVAVGDVVTYVNPANQEETLTSRVIATPQMIGGDFFQTKSDATTVVDAPIPITAITGEVSYVVPKIGYLVEFLRTPLGMALAIYIPALLLLAVEIRRLAKSRDEFHEAGYDPAHKQPIRHFRFSRQS